MPTVPDSIRNTVTIGLPSTTASSSKNGSIEVAIDGGGLVATSSGSNSNITEIPHTEIAL